MKKLFAFLVVAVLAGAAEGAVMNIFVNGNPWTGQDFMPSDSIEVVWHNDVAGVYGGGFGAFQISVSKGDPYFDPWVNSTALPVLPSISITPTDGGFNVYITGGTYMEVPIGDMAGFGFHVPDDTQESEPIIIDPWAGSWNNVYAYPGPDDPFPYVVLHVVPEPASFLVVGLGAVLVYRRGRKR